MSFHDVLWEDDTGLAIIKLIMNSKQPTSQVGSGRVTKKSNNYTAGQKTEPEQKTAQQTKKAVITEPYQIIIEFLESMGLSKTLEVLRQEMMKPRPAAEKNNLLSLFDNGQREQFLSRLAKCTTSEAMSKEVYKKLQFYIQVYFFAAKKQIYPHDQSCVQNFVSYLESRGEQLSKTTELLPYFALPYMPKPMEHRAVEHIFKKQWVKDLRSKLEKWLDDNLKDRKSTKLQLLIEGSTIGSTPAREKQLLSAIEAHKKHYQDLQSNYREMTDLARQNLLDSQQKWFALSRQLYINGSKYLKICQKNNLVGANMLKEAEKFLKYQNFFSNNVQDMITHSANGISVFEQGSCSELDHTNNRRANGRGSIGQLQMDFSKIKQCLVQESEQVKLALLLQALRWRISKTRDPYQRREIVMSYAVNDIIGVRNENRDVVERLFCSSQPVKQHLLRLINAIASDYYGRSYIIENDILLKLLVKCVKEEDYDGIIRRSALNALQKASLRSSAQIFMIQNGIIRWIVQTIKLERDDLSEYSLQILTALLMNMTLKRQGKEKCQRQQILQLLLELLETESQDVRTYVSGSIFSLVGRPLIRQQAKRIKLVHHLSRYLKDESQQFVKQVSYIMQKLEDQEDFEGDGDDQDDQENDIDDIDEEEEEDEDELSQSDVVEGVEGLDCGEELLLKKFSCVGPEAVRQQLLTRSILEEAVKKNLEISIIKEKKTNRSFTTSHGGIFKPQTPAKSSLEILQAMQENPLKKHDQNERVLQPDYDSNKYLPNYASFRKQPATREEEQEILAAFGSKPMIPRTPPQSQFLL